jgi:hypothetical protein
VQPEGPATGQLDQGVPYPSSVTQQTLSRYPNYTSPCRLLMQPPPPPQSYQHFVTMLPANTKCSPSGQPIPSAAHRTSQHAITVGVAVDGRRRREDSKSVRPTAAITCCVSASEVALVFGGRTDRQTHLLLRRCVLSRLIEHPSVLSADLHCALQLKWQFVQSKPCCANTVTALAAVLAVLTAEAKKNAFICNHVLLSVTQHHRPDNLRIFMKCDTAVLHS